jgi:hypothetical protein
MRDPSAVVKHDTTDHRQTGARDWLCALPTPINAKLQGTCCARLTFNYRPRDINWRCFVRLLALFDLVRANAKSLFQFFNAVQRP